MSTPAALLLAGADGRFDASLFTPAALGSDDPFGADRLVAYNGSDGIAAGVVRTSGRFASEDFPHIEMLVVHAGKVLLYSTEPSGEPALELAPGASVVIGRGSAFKLEAEPGTLWAFCAVNRAAAGAEPGLTLLDPRAMLSPSAAPEPQILIGAEPQCRSRNAFEDDASDLRIGVWDSTPYRRHGRPHKLNELMHLVEGSVTLEGADGSRLSAGPGATLFVAQGTPCAWHSTAYVRKFYAVK